MLGACRITETKIMSYIRKCLFIRERHLLPVEYKEIDDIIHWLLRDFRNARFSFIYRFDNFGFGRRESLVHSLCVHCGPYVHNKKTITLSSLHWMNRILVVYQFYYFSLLDFEWGVPRITRTDALLLIIWPHIWRNNQVRTKVRI